MSTYCIGDVQGCFQELQKLLQLIAFDPQNDKLWFVGDLVNRGPNSLETLRFVKQLPNVKVVLGNHDFHLLALYHKATTTKSHDLQPIIDASDAPELIDWLRLQPLLYHDLRFDCVLVHAGIYPWWNLAKAKSCALEVEKILRADDYHKMFKHMYGNKPNRWDENLTGWRRTRFIINSFTRMRFCDAEGHLDFAFQGNVGSQPNNLLPWFKMPERQNKTVKIIFGHWAALEGKVDEANLLALDTGCVWGRSLTALRLDDHKLFAVECKVDKCSIDN